MRPRSLGWVLMGCAVAMALGVAAPWAQISIFGTTLSASGFDTSDGKIVFGCALVVAVGAILLVREGPRAVGVVGLIGGLAAAGISIYDANDIGVDYLGWGLVIDVIASIAAVVVALVALVGHPAEGVLVVPITPSVAHPMWSADPSGRHELRWWNGYRWTEHVCSNGTNGVDPLA